MLPAPAVPVYRPVEGTGNAGPIVPPSAGVVTLSGFAAKATGTMSRVSAISISLG